MAVPCPGCGRAYDPAFFAFGRTLHCACGRRVGIEPRRQPPEPGAEPTFLADAMLGRLARWLRILGFDAAYEAGIADERLARRALEEGRWVLTRDRALPDEWRLPRVVLVAAEEPFEQLREVARIFHLAGGARPFRRCSRCNVLLVPLAPAAARGRVPERIAALHPELRECPACRRVYWPGSHAERMRRVLDRALGAAGDDRAPGDD